MDLPNHHQAVSHDGYYLQTCSAHLTLVVWDGHWLERPCPASPVIELSSQSSVPQGAAGPRCTLRTET